MSGPRASVVLPVRDGGRRLRGLLEALAEQRLSGGLEVVAVDSGSRDGSLQLLARHGVRTLQVAPSDYDHGQTRNLGAREARSPIVVFLSQDAVPNGPCFVERLVLPLEGDPRLAGAFARQLPRPEADPLTRRDVRAWVAGGDEGRIVLFPDPDELDGHSPMERYRLSAFDDVAAAVRRDLLLAEPFESTRFGEDLEWGHRMLRAGRGIAFVPEAEVLHSHPRTARRLYRRNYLGHRLLFRLFGLCTVVDRRHLVRATLGAIRSDLVTLARHGARLRFWLAAPAQAAAATLGQYRGARDERLGRPHPRWA